MKRLALLSLLTLPALASTALGQTLVLPVPVQLPTVQVPARPIRLPAPSLPQAWDLPGLPGPGLGRIVPVTELPPPSNPVRPIRLPGPVLPVTPPVLHVGALGALVQLASPAGPAVFVGH